MLDNFGLGEFLLLATLALLFFGPHRLPQMGAQLGRWLRKLTNYSKAFMNQWSEEAMAVQDAVLEVRGLRDEIVAAQREIRSSLDTARQDIDGAISDAKTQIREAQPNPGAMLDGPLPPQPAATEPPARATAASAPRASDEVAIAKTQQILDDLLKPQDEVAVADTTPAPREAEGVSTADEQAASPPAAEAAAGESEEAISSPQEAIDQPQEEAQEGAEKESAFDRTQQILNQLMGIEPPPDQEPQAEPAAADSAEGEQASTAKPSPEAILGKQLAARPLFPANSPQPSQPTADEAKVAKESAFDRTQQILNQLMGVEPPPGQDVPAGEPGAADTTEAQVSPETPVKEQQEPEAAQKESTLTPTVDLRKQPGALSGTESGISYSKFNNLSIQVALLQKEIEELKKELRALRKEGMTVHAGAPNEANSEAVAVEEVA